MDTTTLERDLRAYRPDGAPSLPEHFVWPRYEGLSVGNLAATVGQALGVTLPGVLPPLRGDLLDGLLDGVQRVVLVVIDALGWGQLQDVMSRRPDLVFHRLAAQGRLWPITTTFLSTTNSVLSTLHTGRPPLEHGLLAYSMFLREWQMAVESISFSTILRPFTGTLAEWGFEAEKFLPVPALGQLLAAQDVASYALTLDGFVKTPLSLMHNRGMQDVFGYATASDFWLMLRRILEQRPGRSFVSAYWNAVDTLAHRLGPLDESGDAEIVSLALLMEEIFLNRLAPAARAGTLLLLTADHGQITTPPGSAILLDRHPALLDALFVPPLGESRVPFFYIRDGRYEMVRQYLDEHFSHQFVFLSQDEVLRSGLLGPGIPYAEVPHRLGDIVGIAIGDAYFARAEELLKKQPMLGRHGGLTSQEMLVPLLAVRLDA
ncbi:MAG TPA: alkaline phosphatase family protein [Anaerolineae bacterium]|nr:alkaline phosphatase family protein [Anaerolineae bacterium]HQH39749.1 alkaline phosphatase family protein [Anaerolineae bacterium]